MRHSSCVAAKTQGPLHQNLASLQIYTTPSPSEYQLHAKAAVQNFDAWCRRTSPNAEVIVKPAAICHHTIISLPP